MSKIVQQMLDDISIDNKSRSDVAHILRVMKMLHDELSDRSDEIVELWAMGKDPSEISESDKSFIKKCVEISPLCMLMCLHDSEASGGAISLLFTDKPHDTSGFDEIYPVDIFLYALRVDLMIHGEGIGINKEFFATLRNEEAVQKFPDAVKRFVFSGMKRMLIGKLKFWRK